MRLLYLMSLTIDPKTKEYRDWYHTKPDAQPPAGLVDHHVARFYRLEHFSSTKKSKENLCQQDTNRCKFLCNMIQTYRNLTKSDEPDIFDITQEQKHILNQLIHIASINWNERKNWYCKCHQFSMNKNLPACFVKSLWTKLNPPAYNIDYVQNICDDNNKKQDGTAPLVVQKNNLLHPDKDLSSKYWQAP